MTRTEAIYWPDERSTVQAHRIDTHPTKVAIRFEGHGDRDLTIMGDARRLADLVDDLQLQLAAVLAAIAADEEQAELDQRAVNLAGVDACRTALHARQAAG